jgi:hypothetical protein
MVSLPPDDASCRSVVVDIEHDDIHPDHSVVQIAITEHGQVDLPLIDVLTVPPSPLDISISKGLTRA